MRYLFSINRYEELLGYVRDIGLKDSGEFDIVKAAIMSVWFFKNMNKVQESREEAIALLSLIDEKLDDGIEDTEGRNLALLAQALLKYCLGEEENSEEYAYEIQEGVSAVESLFQRIILHR